MVNTITLTLTITVFLLCPTGQEISFNLTDIFIRVTQKSQKSQKSILYWESSAGALPSLA